MLPGIGKMVFGLVQKVFGLGKMLHGIGKIGFFRKQRILMVCNKSSSVFVVAQSPKGDKFY